MTDAERDLWAEEVLERISLHHRYDMGGLRVMLDADLADFLDALAVAPLLLHEHERKRMERADIERRRLAWLEQYEIRDCDGNAGGGGIAKGKA